MQEPNLSWDIIVIPQPDGTIISRHVGLTLEQAATVLREVLKDYEADLAKPESIPT